MVRFGNGIKAWQIGLGLLILVAISGGFKLSNMSQLPGSSIGSGTVPYENGWEAKAGLAAVSVGGKGTAFMTQPLPSPWALTGSKGYTQIYADPDGQIKPDSGLPNLEVEVGDVVTKWFLGDNSQWTKEIISQDKIVVKDETGEHGFQYVRERYTFYVRVSVTGDIRHLKTYAGANDQFSTETTYDKGGSWPGTVAEITVYPYFKIDPWKMRENHTIGAWIMKATLDHVWDFDQEVYEKAQAHHGYSTGICEMQTATGQINMYEAVNGRYLETYSFSPQVTPDPKLRTSVYMALSMKMLPGYIWDTWYADEGELQDVPRDLVMKLSVEVLRTDNWEIQTSQHEPDKDKPLRDDEKRGWDFLKWDKLDPKAKILLLLGLGIALLIVLGPYLGLASIGLSTILGRLKK